jgi:hypothetical protein
MTHIMFPVQRTGALGIIGSPSPETTPVRICGCVYLAVAQPVSRPQILQQQWECCRQEFGTSESTSLMYRWRPQKPYIAMRYFVLEPGESSNTARVPLPFLRVSISTILSMLRKFSRSVSPKGMRTLNCCSN